MNISLLFQSFASHTQFYVNKGVGTHGYRLPVGFYENVKEFSRHFIENEIQVLHDLTKPCINDKRLWVETRSS